jgi:NitT/TauT family transport system substrate-binding protein
MIRFASAALTRMALAWGSVAALACAALAMPAPAAAADNLPVVRFQDYPGSGNLQIRVARTKGWCQAAGIVCELKPIPAAPLGLQALIGGSIDVAQTPIEVVAAAVARGGKLKTVVGSAVTNIFQIDAGNTLKLPHEKEGYPAVMQDFKGQKVGVVSRGSATEAFFRFLMQQAGQDPDSVTYVAVGAPMTAFAAVRAGQVPVAVSWEPLGTMCDLTQMCRVVFRGATAKQPALLTQMYGAGTGLVMTDEEIAAHPEIAHAVVKISQQAAAFINDRANEAEVLKISAAYSAFDIPHGDEIAKRTLDLGLETNTFEPIVKRSAVAATLQYLKDTGQLTKLPAVDDIVWKDAPDK